MAPEMQELLAKKEKLERLRPLHPDSVRSLRDALLVEWTYHSNAIEGNTLTLKETRVALEGITVGGKSLREHLEAINHREAILFLEELVASRADLTEHTLRQLHALILKGIDDANAGRYRNSTVLISGAEHRPPDALQVPALMEKLFQWLHGAGREEPAPRRAARLHGDFVGIHPFVDGNGRTSRLIMNLELMKDGWPPVIIRKEDRLRYYEALDRYHTTDDIADFDALCIERLDAALDFWLGALG